MCLLNIKQYYIEYKKIEYAHHIFLDIIRFHTRMLMKTHLVVFFYLISR